MAYPATSEAALARWRATRSPISEADAAEEPLLTPEVGRFALLPLRDPEVFAFRKTIEKLRWVAQEVDLSRDKAHLAEAGPADRRLIEHILSFFAVADELVMDGLDGPVARALPTKEAAAYLRAVADNEEVHSESYSLQVLELVPDARRREEIFEAAARDPAVGKMGDWVRWWTGEAHPAADLFTAMAFIEGTLFSGFFAAIHHYRQAGLFPGLTTFNEFILRDENVHASFWCFLIRHRLRHRPDPAVVESVARETVALCAAFFAEALPGPTPGGLTSADLAQYIRLTADSTALLCGYEPVFGAANPFPWMESVCLNRVSKANFFEGAATSYQTIADPSALSFREKAGQLLEP